MMYPVRPNAIKISVYLDERVERELSDWYYAYQEWLRETTQPCPFAWHFAPNGAGAYFGSHRREN